ncbi:MAG: LuxR C-terminal-related transcriptional regulator [Spirulinaceae cyanobacterium]
MNDLQFNRAFEALTPRRKEVLKLLLAGVCDLEIAQSLHIAESTVRKHIEKICLSFEIHNEFPDERRSKRPELIALFVKYKPELLKDEPSLVTVAAQELPNLITETESKQLSLYNREVFILIDQSGSMVRKDGDTGDQTRYEYLAEIVEGHINRILSCQSAEQRICDRLSVYFFSRKKTPPTATTINDASQVWRLFINNQPKTKTFISPTLNHCLDSWLSNGQKDNQGAFFIIYTDGEFDDEEEFINCIASACATIKHHQEAKFFVLGLGEDINIEHFLALDFNVKQAMPFNIFVFDLVNEVDDIIELLSRQLIETPHLAFPDWVKTRHPEFVQKVLETK